MSVFVCSRCNRLRDTDYIVYHYGLKPGTTADFYEYCDDCEPDVLQAVYDGDLVFSEIDGTDMNTHRVNADLEIVETLRQGES